MSRLFSMYSLLTLQPFNKGFYSQRTPRVRKKAKAKVSFLRRQESRFFFLAFSLIVNYQLSIVNLRNFPLPTSHLCEALCHSALDAESRPILSLRGAKRRGNLNTNDEMGRYAGLPLCPSVIPDLLGNPKK